VTDKDGIAIKVSAWNEQADRFHPLVENDKVTLCFKKIVGLFMKKSQNALPNTVNFHYIFISLFRQSTSRAAPAM
jgi:hypothetical protein